MVPGDAKHVVVADSDEHDEEGHIIEDAETRIKMVQKRLFKKEPLIRKEIEPPLVIRKQYAGNRDGRMGLHVRGYERGRRCPLAKQKHCNASFQRDLSVSVDGRSSTI